LLEDICKEDTESTKLGELVAKSSIGSLAQRAVAQFPSKPAQLAIQQREPIKQAISSDLAEVLQRKERDT